MKGLDVLIVRPPGENHWRGLFEVAQGVEHALRHLDRWQSVRTGGRQILFNAHRLLPNDELDDDTIIFNAEQVSDNWTQSEFGRAYLGRLRRHVVWDYSQTNIERLRKFGVERAVHCRVGYYPQVTIHPVEEDIDVLFVGSMNERRSMLAFDLSAKGLKVETLFDVYGVERDRWIARSKIVLNVHYYENPIFEIFRVSHLLANKKCVVSEDGGCDPQLETFAQAATVCVPYSEIADTCKALVNNPERRRAIAELGHKAFFKIDQVTEVSAALEQSK